MTKAHQLTLILKGISKKSSTRKTIQFIKGSVFNCNEK